MGNEAIVKGLVDMRKYWDALEGDFRVEVSSEDGEDEKKGRTHSVNHGVCTAVETSGMKRKGSWKCGCECSAILQLAACVGCAQSQIKAAISLMGCSCTLK